MNEPEFNSTGETDASIQSLRVELQGLRTLIMGALLVIIVLSGSVNIYMLRQARAADSQVAESRKALEEFDTVSGPIGHEFWVKLTEYGRTHPDINPILAKYSQVISGSGIGGTTTAAPKK